jgi:foldase protein PrsA
MNDNEMQNQKREISQRTQHPGEPLPQSARPMPEPALQPAGPAIVKKAAPWPWIAIALLSVAALVFVLVRDVIVKSNAMEGNEVVGRMDGAAFTKMELYEALEKQMGTAQLAAALDGIMTLKLVDLEANSLGITVSDEEVDAEIADYKSQFDSDDQFELMLEQYGISMDELKDQVAVTVKLRKIFEPRIQPTEEQLQQFFNENQPLFETSAAQVRASHILLETKEEAEAVLAELRGGADFAETAKARSLDEGSRENGGDLDYFTRGVMNEAFESAAFALEKGEMSEVVKSPYGFHIILVTDKKEAVAPSFEASRKQVTNRYLDQEIGNLVGDWIEEKKKAYHYQNLLAEAAE